MACTCVHASSVEGGHGARDDAWLAVRSAVHASSCTRRSLASAGRDPSEPRHGMRHNGGIARTPRTTTALRGALAVAASAVTRTSARSSQHAAWPPSSPPLRTTCASNQAALADSPISAHTRRIRSRAAPPLSPAARSSRAPEAPSTLACITQTKTSSARLAAARSGARSGARSCVAAGGACALAGSTDQGAGLNPVQLGHGDVRIGRA